MPGTHPGTSACTQSPKCQGRGCYCPHFMYGEMEPQRSLATWPKSQSQGAGVQTLGEEDSRMFKMWVNRLKLSPHASDKGRVARGAGAERGALLSWPFGLTVLAVCMLSRVQLCDTTDCCPPSSSVHGIFQARRLEWVAISYSRGSSRPRDRTCVSCVSCMGRRILYHCTAWEALGEGEK